MNLLITGASGFLGKNLTTLLTKNSFSVDAIINYTPIATELQDTVTSLSVDKALCKVEAGDYQAIIHCATSYGRDGNIENVVESNLILPLKILDKVNFNKTVFINIDSFFNKNVSHYYSLPHYSLSKKSLLTWLEYYAQNGLIVNLRLEHLYGAGDSPEKFVSKAIREIGVSQQPFFNMTSGTQKRDFIHVDDVSSATMTLLNKIRILERKYHEYEIGTGKSISIRDFTLEIKKQSESMTELMFGQIPQVIGEIDDSHADSRFTDMFQWKPKIDYIDGIRRCLDSSST